jgi:sugar phosphate isomerase/epimerase
MILSASNIAWDPSLRIQVYELLQENGFIGLEIAPALFLPFDENPFLPSKVNAKLALNEINNYGLQLVSMQSLLFGRDNALMFGNNVERDNFKNGMIDSINFANRFEIPNMVFGSPNQRKIFKGLDFFSSYNYAVEIFKDLGELALKKGTKIAIEANPKIYGTNFLNNFDEAVCFVKDVSHPGIVLNLDLGELYINSPKVTFKSIIAKNFENINHVHISEPGLLPAPKDTDDLLPIIEQLITFGFKKAVSIEMKSNDSLSKLNEKLLKVGALWRDTN